MSVVEECARAEAVIRRVRSLFAAAAVPPVDSAAGALVSAAQATAATAQRTVDNSGVLITRHRAFATTSAATLSGASQTDASLYTHTAHAATITQIGAQRIDAIAAQTRATAQAAAAPSAQSPAAQKVILTALRSQIAAARDVVNTTSTQASELAGQIRALTYPLDRPGPTVPGDVPSPADDNSVASPLLGTPFPDGPIVWCIRPPGVFGNWRCSVLYPDLSVGTYWSPTDDSGGSVP
jgi:hypothetical protein